jgi:Sec-independent protein translocase protein TatA
MFDISWGEIFVVGAVGVALTGRRDLPAASRFVGSQLGRVVGLLQGARARADQFAHQNELKQLQNEFRSGLRELDQVKMELALAASSQGMIGRNLGATTSSANRVAATATVASNSSFPSHAHNSFSPSSTALTAAAASGLPLNDDNHIASPSSIGLPTKNTQISSIPNMDLFDFQVVEENGDKSNGGVSNSTGDTPTGVTQMERAVMEEEWEKQGIGFRSVAEQGQWKVPTSSHGTATWDTSKATGSELLEYLERQCLIFDQYDQAVAKENRAMQERMLQKQQEQEAKDGSTRDDKKDAK